MREERPESPVSDARDARYTGEVEYVPDPRNDPAYWTVREVMAEFRPPLARDGSGGQRRLWAVCRVCTVERCVDLETVAALGHADQPITTLHLRCKCGGNGDALLRWLNPPKPQEYKPGEYKPAKPPRKGSFDFATGTRKGAWD
jgi:hypothetical protein